MEKFTAMQQFDFFYIYLFITIYSSQSFPLFKSRVVNNHKLPTLSLIDSTYCDDSCLSTLAER